MSHPVVWYVPSRERPLTISIRHLASHSLSVCPIPWFFCGINPVCAIPCNTPSKINPAEIQKLNRLPSCQAAFRFCFFLSRFSKPFAAIRFFKKRTVCAHRELSAGTQRYFMLSFCPPGSGPSRLSAFDPHQTPKRISIEPHFSLLPDAGDIVKMLSVWTSGSALWKDSSQSATDCVPAALPANC